MQLAAHRINTISELKRLDCKYSLEIDIRDNNKNLIVVHDPFKKGVLLEKFLKYYNHQIIIANIKSERIEDKVIKTFKKFKIKKYFFLDSSFPKIIDLIHKKKVKNIAVRVSYYEGTLAAKQLKDKANWIWYDTFDGLPKNLNILRYLKNKLNYKICFVSPELHGEKIFIKSKKFQKLKKSNLIDLVCTKKKYFQKWL
tara:strand:+ start:55 stop:648 length:594 start_codon:yes stop_codon:yes gene_type:complete